MVGECLVYENGREMYMSEWGKVGGCDREAFKSWEYEKKVIAIRGDRK